MNLSKLLLCCLVLDATGTFSQQTAELRPQLPSTIVPLSPDAKTLAKSSDLPAFDLYGTLPMNGGGAGLGFGVFSKAIALGEISANQKLEMRLGGDFYFLQYARRKMGNIPLADPQKGDAKLTLSQSNYALNAVVRFQLNTGTSRFKPYADLFAGIRGFSADMNIQPNSVQPGYEESTYNNLSSAEQFNYGASLGLMYSLTRNVLLNTGLLYSTTHQSGQIDNIKRAKIESGSLMIEKMNTPYDFFVFKIGVTFLINKSESREHQCCCSCDCCESDRSSSGLFWALISSAASAAGKSNSININTRPAK